MTDTIQTTVEQGELLFCMMEETAIRVLNEIITQVHYSKISNRKSADFLAVMSIKYKEAIEIMGRMGL